MEALNLLYVNEIADDAGIEAEVAMVEIDNVEEKVNETT